MKVSDLRHLIDMHCDKEEYKEALENCAELMADYSGEVTFDDFFKQGYCHLKVEDCAAAEACFNQALELQPDNVQALSNKGICLYNLGRTKEAFQEFARTIKLNPDVFPAWYYMGVYYLIEYSKTGDPKTMARFITCFRRVIGMASDLGAYPIHDVQRDVDCSIDTFLMLHNDVPDVPVDELTEVP
jgi:tetratricopeptide (TPR) repeat protein